MYLHFIRFVILFTDLRLRLHLGCFSIQGVWDQPRRRHGSDPTRLIRMNEMRRIYEERDFEISPENKA